MPFLWGSPSSINCCDCTNYNASRKFRLNICLGRKWHLVEFSDWFDWAGVCQYQYQSIRLSFSFSWFPILLYCQRSWADGRRVVCLGSSSGLSIYRNVNVVRVRHFWSVFARSYWHSHPCPDAVCRRYLSGVLCRLQRHSTISENDAAARGSLDCLHLAVGGDCLGAQRVCDRYVPTNPTRSNPWWGGNGSCFSSVWLFWL